MKSQLTSMLLGLGLGVLGQAARSQSVTLPVQLIDGTHTTLALYLALPTSPVLTETLADGTRHERFYVSGNGEYSEAWSLGGGGYYPEDFLPPASVDTFLSPSGASSLTLAWGFTQSCHGGCTSSSDLQLLLDSTSAALFSPSLTSGTFQGYANLTGQVRSVYRDLVPPDDSHIWITDFSGTAVPEPSTAALALTGWALLIGLIGIGRRRAGATRILKIMCIGTVPPAPSPGSVPN